MKLLFGYQILLFIWDLEKLSSFQKCDCEYSSLTSSHRISSHHFPPSTQMSSLKRGNTVKRAFVLLWPINLLLSPLLTWFRALSNMCAHLLAKMDCSMGAHGRLSTQIMGWWPLCFWLPRNLPGHVHLGKFSWPQEWQMWSSYIFIPAEFSSFILGVSGKTKFHFILLDKLQLLCPEAHLSPTSLILASPSDSSFFDLNIFIVGK